MGRVPFGDILLTVTHHSALSSMHKITKSLCPAQEKILLGQESPQQCPSQSSNHSPFPLSANSLWSKVYHSHLEGI